MPRIIGKTLLIMAGAGMLMAAAAGTGFARGGPGGGNDGSGGEDPPWFNSEACLDCYEHHYRPRIKMTGDNCCWQRVQKKRIRINGVMRTVYVNKGRTCVKVTNAQQCMKRARRGR